MGLQHEAMSYLRPSEQALVIHLLPAELKQKLVHVTCMGW